MKKAKTAIVVLIGLSLFMFSCDTYHKGSNNLLTEEQKYLMFDGSVLNDTTQKFPDKLPKFRGLSISNFRSYIMRNLTYPKSVVRDGIGGTVYVTFVVDEQGHTENVYVTQGVDFRLDKAVVEVVTKANQWTPGMLDGKPVKVQFTMPISFKLASSGE